MLFFKADQPFEFKSEQTVNHLYVRIATSNSRGHGKVAHQEKKSRLAVIALLKAALLRATGLTYAAFLHSRIAYGWRGRRSAYFAVIAFLFVVFSYLGVNYLFPGLHSYA